MHRAANWLVASERERQVRKPPRIMRMGTKDSKFLQRLDKVDAVIIMLFDSRRHREDIGVEDNVLGRESDAKQQIIGSLANLDLTLLRVGLTCFVERHDDDRSAIGHAQPCMM